MLLIKNVILDSEYLKISVNEITLKNANVRVMEDEEYSYVYYYSATILVLIATVVIYVFQKYTYWTQRGVVQIRPLPLFGNYAEFVFLKKPLYDVAMDIYNTFPLLPYVGGYFLNNKLLVVRDPELIKNVMTKDFYYFSGRGIHIDPRDEFGINLFTSEGDEWKIWRQNLTPLFTSSKMKNMMYLMVECSKTLETYLKAKVKNNKMVDIRKTTSDFTLEVIGSCAFGIQMNSMNEDSNNFRVISRKIFETSIGKSLKGFLRFISPKMFYALKFKVVDATVTKFITDVLKEISNSRKGNAVLRHDFVDLLMDIRSRGHIEGDSFEKTVDNKNVKKKITIDEINMGSQFFIFFAAGFETSSTTMSYTLYELAKNRHIQAKLREEINATLKEGKGEIIYELLAKMNYLDMVIDETLRLYPVLGVLSRKCINDYKIPESDLVIEKGTLIHIPLKGLQRDPKYFNNPDQFNPDNFLPEVKAARHPYTYMPFGEGPRNCIGLRFGKMQVKIGLITILSKYDIFPSERTQDKIQFDPQSILPIPIGGIHLDMVPLKVK